MTQDANDQLMSGGAASAKFEKIGAKVSGVIARKPELRQQRDIKNGTPLTWDDGSPRQQIVVILKTDERAGEDDNGERSLWIKIPSAMQKSIQEAVKKAGATGLQAGGKLAVKYVKDGEKKKAGFNAPKLYAALYEAPDPLAMAATSEPEAAESEDASGLDDF